LAVVSQQPTLFDTSVGENIRYGSLAKADEMATMANVITDMDIRTAAKWANIHQVIMTLGDGYDTVFGTNAGGGGLSGGHPTSPKSSDRTSPCPNGSSLQQHPPPPRRRHVNLGQRHEHLGRRERKKSVRCWKENQQC
jgi:hypothetical protein